MHNMIRNTSVLTIKMKIHKNKNRQLDLQYCLLRYIKTKWPKIKKGK